MMPRHIHTNIPMNQNIYNKMGFSGSNSLCPIFIQKSFFCGTSSLYTPMGSGVARRDPAHVTHKVNLCMHTIFKSVAPRVCMAKVPFLALFGPDMNIEIGVAIYMYFKHSPDYTDSKYIYMGSWSNALGSSVFAYIPFLIFLALHWKRKRCGQVGPSPCYSQSEVAYAY